MTPGSNPFPQSHRYTPGAAPTIDRCHFRDHEGWRIRGFCAEQPELEVFISFEGNDWFCLPIGGPEPTRDQVQLAKFALLCRQVEDEPKRISLVLADTIAREISLDVAIRDYGPPIEGWYLAVVTVAGIGSVAAKSCYDRLLAAAAYEAVVSWGPMGGGCWEYHIFVEAPNEKMAANIAATYLSPYWVAEYIVLEMEDTASREREGPPQ